MKELRINHKWSIVYEDRNTPVTVLRNGEEVEGTYKRLLTLTAAMFRRILDDHKHVEQSTMLDTLMQLHGGTFGIAQDGGHVILKTRIGEIRALNLTEALQAALTVLAKEKAR